MSAGPFIFIDNVKFKRIHVKLKSFIVYQLLLKVRSNLSLTSISNLSFVTKLHSFKQKNSCTTYILSNSFHILFINFIAHIQFIILHISATHFFPQTLSENLWALLTNYPWLGKSASSASSQVWNTSLVTVYRRTTDQSIYGEVPSQYMPITCVCAHHILWKSI